MPAPGARDDRAADAVAGRYVRQERLGSGGFGVVWRAHDTLLRRDVALKEIAFPAGLDEAEQASLRDKVLREARAAARLSHPGLVAVYDVAEDEGHPVIVMELVAAPTLADVVATEGPLADERAADIGAKVLEALAIAHEQGVVHRDVKPANVMVHPSGRVQLGDFGVASIADDPRVTASGRMAGSPSYMAPEQAHADPATPATDLWGLGATLYFAVEAQPPFAKDTAIATLTSVVADEPRPMQTKGWLAPLIRDLLAKDPLARPSADEVRRRLLGGAPAGTDAADAAPTTQFRTEDHFQTEVLEPRPAATAPRPVRTVRPTAPPPVRRQRSVGAIVAIAVVIVAALVAIAAVIQSRATPSGSPDRSSDSTETTESEGAPPDWVAYQDPATGFAISHPPDWSIRTNGTLTDFREPDTGAYLRVDHQQPPGPSPEGAWETLEARFAAEYPDYRRIRLTPTTYKGHRSALWEFTYTDRGAPLRAVDLGFIAGEYGFALNFQTRAGDWDRLQPVFDNFKASFQPPA